MRNIGVTRQQEGQLFTISLVAAVVVFTSIWLSAPLIANYFAKPEMTAFLRMTAFVILLVPLHTINAAILERDLGFATLARINVLTGVSQSVVVLILAIAGYGVWALGAGVICNWVVQTAASCWKGRWRPILAWPDLKCVGLVRFGVTVAFTYLIWFAHSNADKAVISTTLGPVALGLYALAFQFAAFPAERITSSINKVAFPVYSQLLNDPDRLRDWYLRLITLLFATTAPVLIGAALVAADMLPLLLGEKWRGLVLPFQFLAPAGMFIAIATTLSPLLNALGRPDIPMKNELTCAIVYPIAFLAAAKFHGLLAVCAVWLFLYPIQTVAIIQISRETTGISIFHVIGRLAPFIKEVLAAMVIAVWLVQSATGQMNAGVRILASVAAGGSAYAAAVAFFMGQDAMRSIGDFIRDLSKSRS